MMIPAPVCVFVTNRVMDDATTSLCVLTCRV